LAAAPDARLRAIKKNIRVKHSEQISMASRSNPSVLIVPPSASTMTDPPANLGPAGTNLWRSIMTEFDVGDAGGRALLEQAALAYDRAERLRVEIDAAGEIIHTRNGPREHPGLKGELAARSFICRTLQRLGINLEAVRLGAGRPSGPEWRGHANE
jgi:hypothetical protein